MYKLKESYECSLNLTHDLIGGKWKLQILAHIRKGENRFSLLDKTIPNISQKVLSSQLKELEATGLIIKEVIDDNPPKIIIYHINDKYNNLNQVIDLLCEFSEEYANNNGIELG